MGFEIRGFTETPEVREIIVKKFDHFLIACDVTARHAASTKVVIIYL